MDLAKTDNPVQMPDADKEDSLLVAVMRDGSIFFGSDKVTPEVLTDKVKDRLANRADKRVYIKADARAKYGAVVEVVDNVRSAGVDELGLLTEQRKQGSFEPLPASAAGVNDCGQEEEPRVDLTPNPRNERIAAPWVGARLFYGNVSWRQRRSLRRHQRNTADRRAAGAADYLHGDHAVHAERPGCAGSPAA